MNTTTYADRYIAGTLATLDLWATAAVGDIDTEDHPWFELYDWMLTQTTMRPLGELDDRYCTGLAANDGWLSCCGSCETQRMLIIRQLVALDPNGIWTDADSLQEGFPRMSLEHAQRRLAWMLSGQDARMFSVA